MSEEKSFVDEMIDQIAVKEMPKPANIQDGELYATHEGIMQIGDKSLRVYILSDGKRIIDAEDVDNFFKSVL